MSNTTGLVSGHRGVVTGVRAVVVVALVVRRFLRRVQDVWLRFVQHV